MLSGRVEYLTVLEGDEVYLVAKLLGELFAYRASGAGHADVLQCPLKTPLHATSVRARVGDGSGSCVRE